MWLIFTWLHLYRRSAIRMKFFHVKQEKNAQNICAVCGFIFTWILSLSNFSNVRREWLTVESIHFDRISLQLPRLWAYLLVGLNECRDKCVCARVNMAVQLRKAIPKDLKYRNDMILLFTLFSRVVVRLTFFTNMTQTTKNVETEKMLSSVNAEIWHE